MKREIINFSKKFSSRLFESEAKFNADMLYGIVAPKKQIFDFENFRVRKLRAINALNSVQLHFAVVPACCTAFCILLPVFSCFSGFEFLSC